MQLLGITHVFAGGVDPLLSDMPETLSDLQQFWDRSISDEEHQFFKLDCRACVINCDNRKESAEIVARIPKLIAQSLPSGELRLGRYTDLTIETHNLTLWHKMDNIDSCFWRVICKILYICSVIVPICDWLSGLCKSDVELILKCDKIETRHRYTNAYLTLSYKDGHFTLPNYPAAGQRLHTIDREEERRSFWRMGA